uniref:Uncharacterized protein n=1 Tax=Wuchereria bancrofti TaxID=6293 RepID=A0A1I8EEE5_WUCBA
MQEYFQSKDKKVHDDSDGGFSDTTASTHVSFMHEFFPPLEQILFTDKCVLCNHKKTDYMMYTTDRLVLRKISRGCHIDLYLLSVIWEKKQTVATMCVMLGVIHQNVGYSVMMTKSNLLVKTKY